MTLPYTQLGNFEDKKELFLIALLARSGINRNQIYFTTEAE
jgi:hypothetical protein